VLVQPATVARWQREGFHGWWRHRSRRRPGRPRIDLQLRSLMGHMATENCLWGAPRIHSEVLKLGFTWRTFLANHLGAAFSSPVTASDAPGDNHVVRGCKFTFGFAASPGNESGASNQWAAVDWPPSLQRTSLGCRGAQAHLHHCCKGTSSRGPPRSGIVASGPTAYLRRFLRPDHPSGSRPVSQWSEMHRSPGLDRYRHLGLSFLKRLRSNRETVACARLSGRPEYWRATGCPSRLSTVECHLEMTSAGRRRERLEKT